MPNPTSSAETKVELLTEAIEALVLAQVVAITSRHISTPATRLALDVVDARANLSAALHEFTKPTLRVVGVEREERVGDIATILRHTELTR